MSYTRFHDVWQDATYDSDGDLLRPSTTPITAAALGHLEDGIAAASASGPTLVLGTTAGTACEGNDGRLADARTPKAHAGTHASGGSDDLSTLYLPRSLVGAAGGAAAYNDSRLSDARAWALYGGGTPSTGQVLTWNGTAFAPATPASGGSATVSDASTTAKGVVQLAGDLAGTAAAPTVPGLANAEKTANKNVANGYAGLDSNASIPAARQYGASTSSYGIITLAGDLAGTAAAPTVPALAGKAPLDANALVPPANLPPRDGLYPLAEYGLSAATLHPDVCTGASAAEGASRLGLYRLWIPSGVAITGLVMFCTVAGASPGSGTASRFAVYSDAGALLGSSADDAALFTSTGARLKALGTPIAAQTVGRFVYAGFVHQLTTAPKVLTAPSLVSPPAYTWKVSGGAVVSTANLRVQVQTTVTTALPSSFTPSAANTDYPLAFVGVY